MTDLTEELKEALLKEHDARTKDSGWHQVHQGLKMLFAAGEDPWRIMTEVVKMIRDRIEGEP